MSGLSIFGPHSLLGLAALTCFWTALLSSKGSALHRRWGRRYLLLAGPLMLTVVPIAVAIIPPERLLGLSLQLVYLAVVFASAGWTAWRAIRDRGDVDAFRGGLFRSLAALLLVLGLALLSVGIVQRSVLAVGFSAIGIVYGGAMAGFLGQAATPGWWLQWHLNGVCLLFAATHASFIGVLCRHLWPAHSGESMHALTQLGTIAFAYLLRQGLRWRYERPHAPHLTPIRTRPVARR